MTNNYNISIIFEEKTENKHLQQECYLHTVETITDALQYIENLKQLEYNEYFSMFTIDNGEDFYWYTSKKGLNNFD